MEQKPSNTSDFDETQQGLDHSTFDDGVANFDQPLILYPERKKAINAFTARLAMIFPLVCINCALVRLSPKHFMAFMCRGETQLSFKTRVRRCSSIGFILAAFSVASPAFGYLCWGDLGDLSVAQPISVSDFQKIRRLNIKTVDCYPGAEQLLFDSSKNFPHLNTVWFRYDNPALLAKLDKIESAVQTSENRTFSQAPHAKDVSPNNIAQQLISLARNYSNLHSLYIHCESEVPTDALKEVPNFTRLRLLGLKGNISNNISLSFFLPSSAHELWLKHSNLCLSNPNFSSPTSLKLLELRNCEITGSFLSNLKSPQLREIRMQDCRLSVDAIDAINHLTSVRKIDVDGATNVSAATVKYWREVRKINVLWVINDVRH